MNNICVDLDRGVVTVESRGAHAVTPEAMPALLTDVLDVLAYGGEQVCVEVKRDGLYCGGAERWSVGKT